MGSDWGGFYEIAWERRFQFFRELIDQGERHPLRIIQKLAAFERFNAFRIEEGRPTFAKKYESSGEVENVSVKDGTFQVSSGPLPTGIPSLQRIPFNDRTIEIPSYYSRRIDHFLIDVLANSRFDAVVELGSGYGQNLIELFYHGGPLIPYYAGEFTESGTRCAHLLASLTSDLTLIPFHFDYRNPDLSAVKERGRILLFTCHSIEQMGEISMDLIRCLAGHAREVTCLHLEPFGFQMLENQKGSPVDEEQREFFRENDYNRNLLSILFRAHQEGLIRLSYIGKNVMGGYPSNPTSLAVWHNLLTGPPFI